MKATTSDPNYRSVLDGLYLFPGTVGNIYFVSSVTGGSTGPGWAPENAYSTLATAFAVCVAGNNDTIIICPGHVETVGAAAYATLATNTGVTIIGLGTGRSRPIFTWATSTAAQIIVTAASTRFSNIVFDFTGIDAVVAAISIGAADVSFTDCEFICNNGTAGCVLGVFYTTGSLRGVVKNCRFIGPATNTGTTTTAQLKMDVGADFVIQGCYFTGKMTQAILNVTTLLGGLINNNDFVIYTGTKAIAVASASTPFISGNRINVPSGTAPVVAAAGFVAGNAYSAAAGVTAGTALTW